MNVCLHSNVLKFKNEVQDELILDLKRIKLDDNYLNDLQAQKKLQNLISWLSSAPQNVVFRINTILCEQQVACNSIKDTLNEKYSESVPSVTALESIPELIIVKSCKSPKDLNWTKEPHEIIVDASCGAAVLRGSHIYAPGVLGMPRGLNVGDNISVYTDLKQTCKRGLITVYDNESKLFIGNGTVQMTRDQIFKHDNQNCSGIAIIMTDTISCTPQLNENILPKGHVLLQNLPSIICCRVLDPQPGESILDMCAAPGNKTTHIAALMNNKGTVIALEKIKSKLERLNSNIKNFVATNVKAFCFDSTKAVCDSKETCISNGPPFAEESFDRILLDGPCSALGQRPQLRNPISVSQLRSYVPLQRKLFSTAYQLLKPGGTLVYSTCTITVAENEGIVAWALKTFPKLELQSVREKLTSLNVEQFGSTGYNIDGLTVEQSNQLCRFGCESDFVGFFIACFVKKKYFGTMHFYTNE